MFGFLKRKQTPAQEPELIWQNIAYQILLSCRSLADRVDSEGVRLMLTDTDWATLEGFQLIIKQAPQSQLLPLCITAGLNKRQFDAMLDLYNYKKKLV